MLYVENIWIFEQHPQTQYFKIILEIHCPLYSTTDIPIDGIYCEYSYIAWLRHKPETNSVQTAKGSVGKSTDKKGYCIYHRRLIIGKTHPLILLTFRGKQQSDAFSFSPSLSTPTLLTPPICQPLQWHPSFIWGPLGHVSSHSSWHALNQNGSFLPWNGCLAALTPSL